MKEPATRKPEPSRREELFAAAALGVIILITIAWWMLALWPVADSAALVLRTRAVCFGATASGLPDAEGWALLVGQPMGMTAVLLVGWGRATRSALARIVASVPGRLSVAAVGVILLLGSGGAAVRVANAAAAAGPPGLEAAAAAPDESRRLDHAPYSALALTDQSGDRFDLARYRGRPVLVTFAFAHCETVCPVLVREVLAAQGRAATEGPRPAVVVVTVDPWRDTPSRLPSIAEGWSLPGDAHVLSGSVDAVLGELRSWRVHAERDTRTGNVVHPALTYVIDPDGRVAFATTSGQDHLAGLLERVRR
jgi:protein SCO1/2